MKKVIRRKDGTDEIVEGTPEEIVAYERLIRGQDRAAPSKDVLHGSPCLPPFWDWSKVICSRSDTAWVPIDNGGAEPV